jgi:hypothetical protein
MNNTQLYLTIGIPTFTVILAWLSNRAELNRNIERVDRSLDALRSEIVALRNDHHKDNLALMGYMVPLRERMA